MKSVVRVDGGGTGIAIDVGRDRGDDCWDDSHAERLFVCVFGEVGRCERAFL
jgi:hypothetical protein